MLTALPIAVALPKPANANEWSPGDWLARWGRLGCGARVGSAGHPALTPRLHDRPQNAACAGMLAELTAERLTMLGDALRTASPL